MDVQWGPDDVDDSYNTAKQYAAESWSAYQGMNRSINVHECL